MFTIGRDLMVRCTYESRSIFHPSIAYIHACIQLVRLCHNSTDRGHKHALHYITRKASTRYFKTQLKSFSASALAASRSRHGHRRRHHGLRTPLNLATANMERHSHIQNPAHFCLKTFAPQDAMVPNHHHNKEWPLLARNHHDNNSVSETAKHLHVWRRSTAARALSGPRFPSA
jgi:hypothetical protein